MKRPFLIIYLTIILYMAAYFAFRPMVVRNTRPPLHDEFQEIASYTYAYFDKHQKMPANPDYLPASLRDLVDTGKGITWDEDKTTFLYTYPGRYPVNIPFIEVATFGLIKGKRTSTGRLITPDSVINNTPIHKRDGALPELPHDPS